MTQQRQDYWLRRPGCLVALAVVVFAPIRVWVALRPCYTHVILESLPSPDGAWIAVLKEDAVFPSWGGGDITAGVDLAVAGRASRPIEILGVDTGGHLEERPRIEWASPNVLRVTVPNLSYLKVLTTQVGDVHVDVRYDPDDPEAREAWREELAAPFGQCNDCP